MAYENTNSPNKIDLGAPSFNPSANNQIINMPEGNALNDNINVVRLPEGNPTTANINIVKLPQI